MCYELHAGTRGVAGRGRDTGTVRAPTKTARTALLKQQHHALCWSTADDPPHTHLTTCLATALSVWTAALLRRNVLLLS